MHLCENALPQPRTAEPPRSPPDSPLLLPTSALSLSPSLLSASTPPPLLPFSLSACLRRPSLPPLLLFTAAARSWKLRIWQWGVAWRKGGSRSGSSGRPMPVLWRAGQPRSHRGRRPSPPPSLWRSSPPGFDKGEARSTGSAGLAASWSGGSSPPGSGEGAARSTGGAGWAASWSGGSSPPDPARAAAAGRMDTLLC